MAITAGWRGCSVPARALWCAGGLQILERWLVDAVTREDFGGSWHLKRALKDTEVWEARKYECLGRGGVGEGRSGWDRQQSKGRVEGGPRSRRLRAAGL